MENELKLFEAGIKPVIMIPESEAGNTLYRGIREKYLGVVIGGNVLYFKTLSSVNEFVDKLEEAREEYGEAVKVSTSKFLGDILGYPPLATEAWGKYFLHEDKNKRTKAEVNYYGMKFLCLPEDADSCIEWLKKHRPVPKEVQESISTGITVKNIK